MNATHGDSWMGPAGAALGGLILVYTVFHFLGMLTPERALIYALLAIGLMWWSKKHTQSERDTR